MMATITAFMNIPLLCVRFYHIFVCCSSFCLYSGNWRVVSFKLKGSQLHGTASSGDELSRSFWLAAREVWQEFTNLLSRNVLDWWAWVGGMKPEQMRFKFIRLWSIIQGLPSSVILRRFVSKTLFIKVELIARHHLRMKRLCQSQFNVIWIEHQPRLLPSHKEVMCEKSP